MRFIDIDSLKGFRVFVETEPVDGSSEGHAYLGTLNKVNDLNISLGDWIIVNEWDETHICDYTNGTDVHDSWNGELFLCTVGLLREVKRIEINFKKGDPHEMG